MTAKKMKPILLNLLQTRKALPKKRKPQPSNKKEPNLCCKFRHPQNDATKSATNTFRLDFNPAEGVVRWQKGRYLKRGFSPRKLLKNLAKLARKKTNPFGKATIDSPVLISPPCCTYAHRC